MVKIHLQVEVKIDKKEFTVNDDEFDILPHQEYNNLKILDKVGYYERIIGLISELTKSIKPVDCFLNINSTHGGFVDIRCSDLFSQVFILNSAEYEWINDLDLDLKDRRFDLTFIDTWHVYGQLKRELAS